MSTSYGGPYGRDRSNATNDDFWRTFNEFYHATLDIDVVLRDLWRYPLDSRRYVESSDEIDRLASAAEELLSEMCALAGDDPDEKTALLASAAQFIETNGVAANEQAADVIHLLARKGAETVSDPDFQAMIMALLNRATPNYDVKPPEDDDADDGPPVPGL
jgi:hypothetical protein